MLQRSVWSQTLQRHVLYISETYNILMKTSIIGDLLSFPLHWFICRQCFYPSTVWIIFSSYALCASSCNHQYLLTAHHYAPKIPPLIFCNNPNKKSRTIKTITVEMCQSFLVKVGKPSFAKVKVGRAKSIYYPPPTSLHLKAPVHLTQLNPFRPWFIPATIKLQEENSTHTGGSSQ